VQVGGGKVEWIGKTEREAMTITKDQVLKLIRDIVEEEKETWSGDFQAVALLALDDAWKRIRCGIAALHVQTPPQDGLVKAVDHDDPMLKAHREALGFAPDAKREE
jgi:hypothetical protein